tara:strand:+ start:2721 stop:2843 length:123 start_codon:yes stop_codon:yes gene_type:complete
MKKITIEFDDEDAERLILLLERLTILIEQHFEETEESETT